MLIKDKEYNIRFTMNTLCTMSEQGIDVMNIENSGMNNIMLTRELLYYGLKHENKKITKAQTGDLIDDYIEEGGTFNELYMEVMLALAKSLGVSDKIKKEIDDIDDEEKTEGKL